jgi:hypothetical protein
MWFTDVTAVENPGKKELRLFIQDVQHFLLFILEDRQNFGFLWQHDPSLYDAAMDTLKHDIAQSAGQAIDKAFNRIDNQELDSFGLQGRPLKFKFQVLNTIADQWKSVHRDFSVRVWLRQIVNAIDAILDPLVDVTNGAGRQIRDFKNAIASLA